MVFRSRGGREAPAESENAPASAAGLSAPLIVGAAAVPSVASLVWTAWSIADMVPAPWPVALAAGIMLDLALVAAVAIAWVAPAVARPATAASWLFAAAAAVAIGVHGYSIAAPVALLAVIPLAAKGLWELALRARYARLEEAEWAEAAAAEEERRRAEAEAARAARLSAELTEAQQAELAELDREAAYVTARAQREIALAEAEAAAAQERRLAEIRRGAEAQMATDEATAKIHVRRAELAEQIRLAAPLYAPQLGAAVPDDLSGLDGGAMGFGGALAQAGAAQAPQVRTGHDLGAPPPASPVASPGGASPLPEPHRRLLDYIAAQGGQASVKGAARTLGVDPRTVRRWRDALNTAGHDVAALYADR